MGFCVLRAETGPEHAAEPEQHTSRRFRNQNDWEVPGMKKVCLLLLCSLLLSVCCACQQISEKVEDIIDPPVYFNGEEVDEETAAIEIRSDSDLAELSELTETLTGLRTISYENREPTLEELENLRQIFPDAEITYEVTAGPAKVPYTATELDLSGLKHSETDAAIQAMQLLPDLTSVNLGGVPAEEPVPETEDGEGDSSQAEPQVQETADASPDASAAEDSGAEAAEDPDALLLEDVAHFQEAYPDISFQYRFRLFDRVVSLQDTELDLNGVEMTDGGAEVRRVLPYLKQLTYLNMENTGVSNEDMAQLRDDFPDINVVWRIWFGHFTCRTDTEKILAAVLSWPLKGEDVQVLKYCTKVKYLDLGHNQIDDISFIQYMPDLEVAIVAINKWSDATPLASCKKLEYLEMFNNNCADVSCLPALTNLKHLNVCYLHKLTDITPLYQMTWLERLWVGCVNSVPREQLNQLHEALPNTIVNTTCVDPTSEGWRKHERYTLLRQQFGYKWSDYSIS